MEVIKQIGIGGWSLACDLLARREEAFFGDAKANHHSPFLPSMRVALVKQSTYTDLYSDPQAPTTRALIESSWHRPGPVGLFTEFDSTFFIVHLEPDTECKVWEEKIGYAVADRTRAAADAHRRAVQSAVAVDAESIDWSAFDIVIAIECAVPARITKRHPLVIWATMLEHHRMRPYHAWLREPPVGYDVFLNLRYGPNPQSILKRRHVIDWPYNFTAPGALRRLYGEGAQGSANRARLRVLIEDNQSTAMTNAVSVGGCTPLIGCRQTLKDYLEQLLAADVLAFPAPSRPLGGLAMLDAASAGVLLAGNRRALWNPFLVEAEMHSSDPKTCVAKLRRVAEDEVFRRDALSRQTARLSWFGFRRPLEQLARFVAGSERPLNAADRLVSTQPN
jgi:hypothetical protein